MADMPKRDIEAKKRTKAVVKRRLIDFDTGKHELRPEHRKWLDDNVVPFVTDPKNLEEYWVELYAYASKKGNASMNLDLSVRRAASVEFYLGDKVRDFSTHVRTSMGVGEAESTGGEDDNSPIWRAVEVHVFRTPDDVEGPKPPVKSKRTKNWSVKIVSKNKGFGPGKYATIAGVFATFRNDDTSVETDYFVPAFGLGGKVPDEMKELLKNLLKELEGLKPPPPPGKDGFAKMNVVHPFTARMIDGANANFLMQRMVVTDKMHVPDSNGKDIYKAVTIGNVDASKVKTMLAGGPLLSLELFR